MVKVKEDLTGQVFGRLIVLERADDYIDSQGWHRLCWKCKCVCANQTILNVKDNNLKTGNTRSCGCLQKEQLVKRSKEQFKKYNDYEIQEDYVIMYTTKSEPFYVDLDDFWKVRNICWCKNNGGYLTGELPDGTYVLLHRYVMDCPDNMVVDHIKSEAKYDNRKSNLRIATASQNGMNKQKSKRNTSGVTGVCWYKAYNKWKARITISKKEIHLGYFDSFDDAVKARKEAEEKYFGEYSYDNSQSMKGE